MKVSLKYTILLLLSIFVILFSGTGAHIAFAEDPTPTPTPTPATSSDDGKVQDLQKQIADLQNKISTLQGQKKTLSSQISVMDSQIRLTQLRISATKQEIATLTKDITTTTKKIDNLEKELDMLTEVVLNRIVATYEVGSLQTFQILFASNGFSDFLSRVSYLRIAQANDKKLIYEAQQAKIDYVNQKEIFEDKKIKVESLQKQLVAYTTQLDQDKSVKQRLLVETQGSEATYQQLLAQARAQLAGFQKFAQSQGGATILSNQTVCDDWGCYYNQRDSNWGETPLNHTGYTLASAGCLVTSMAMVYTHYGYKNATPQTINSIPENFASYEPAWLKKTITVDGKTTSRISASIDDELNAGRPVIVGISYDGGPIADHFVVIISGSNGNYKMNDPFTPNGKNINFSDHYLVGSIKEIEKIIF